ncbi:MAG: ABC transporter permease [Phycisphaerales bacterium]|nr:ABC transporter permease [Phycisphaerales bacterium]
MIKTFLVARREFVTTVFTKGFLLGVLMTPVMIVVVVGAISLTQMLKGPTVKGTVAVIDKTEGGVVGPRVLERFSPERLERDRAERAAAVEKMTTDQAGKMGIAGPQTQTAGRFATAAMDNELAKLKALSVSVLPAGTDLEEQKRLLGEVDVRGKPGETGTSVGTIAVAVVPEGALRPDGAGDYPKFDLLTANRLDPEITGEIERRVGQAIVDARVASDPRLSAGGLNVQQLRRVLDAPDAQVGAVTAGGGVKKSAGVFQFMLPMAFMLLLMMSVMTGGNYLLTTTIEEKSSRVMEVLLSAVSPMELMVGKILGQMCVGLVILVVYSGMGIASLFAFAMQHQLDPMMLVYLVVFFLIAFTTIASMMAAVGSAVNELREAQSLMTPLMLLIMTPWLLWMPISRAPNSMFATILSFVPGVNPFVMMLRLSGSEPPPAWQPPVAILVGLVTVVACAWGAAKVFRVGVLMYGKPPDMRTLWRWIRMA